MSTQASKVIDLVSDEAAKHNFTIANINSENLTPVKDEAGNEIERNGKKLKRVPIHIEFETNLNNITSFLRSLSDSKHLWVMDTMTIKKNASNPENLECEMTLIFFAY